MEVKSRWYSEEKNRENRLVVDSGAVNIVAEVIREDYLVQPTCTNRVILEHMHSLCPDGS